MATQADLDWDNTVSRNEQRKNRFRRNKSKELRAAFKETLGSLDNTKDKRELREQFESSLKDIDTGLESNRAGSGSTIQDDGIDNVGSTDLGGGVYDLNTRLDDNKEGTDERIQNDGIDRITSPLKDGSGGGGGGGGGDFELDVVDDDNNAARASFTGGGIIIP